jgi:hypothetical protein
MTRMDATSRSRQNRATAATTVGSVVVAQFGGFGQDTLGFNTTRAPLTIRSSSSGKPESNIGTASFGGEDEILIEDMTRSEAVSPPFG